MNRQNAVRRFFDERLARLDIQETTRTKQGTIIDWLPAPKEVPPPPASRPTFELVEGEELAKVELDEEPSARGPEGTVPQMRFDVEAYLAAVGDEVPANPVDVLYSIPAPAPEANGRYYVQWRLTKTASSSAFWGGAVNISLWNSETDTVGNPNTTYADTNIAQIAVSRGTGSALQTVEAGKIESEVQGGVPRFFVYYTTNNYEEVEDPDWVGGYIPVVKGFKQTHPTIFPGTAFQAGQLSVLGGAQRIWFFEVSHSASGNAWWVYVNGEQVGFFPECHNANDAAPCSAQNPYLFSSTGMRPEANTVSYYGEVNDSWAPNATYTDMGSGKPASAGWTQAAYMRAMQVTPSGSLSNWQWLHQAPGALSTRVTDAGCYSMGGPFFNGGPGWQNWFYFGGMGALNLGFPLPTMNPNCPLN